MLIIYLPLLYPPLKHLLQRNRWMLEVTVRGAPWHMLFVPVSIQYQFIKLRFIQFHNSLYLNLPWHENQFHTTKWIIQTPLQLQFIRHAWHKNPGLFPFTIERANSSEIKNTVHWRANPMILKRAKPSVLYRTRKRARASFLYPPRAKMKRPLESKFRVRPRKEETSKYANIGCP